MKIDYCIDTLLKSKNISQQTLRPGIDKLSLFRSLRTRTIKYDLGEKYYKYESEILRDQLKNKNITVSDEITERLTDNIYIFRGDITTIEADAIVNAANKEGLGCFVPFHGCIDNAIHSAAGLALRKECNDILRGGEIETGAAIITGGYSLPSKFVIHTVGPNLNRSFSKTPSEQHEAQLRSCYKRCLEIAANSENIHSVVFCSISTGLYGYPIESASKIAIEEISNALKKGVNLKVIINTFSEGDYNVYRKSAEEYKSNQKST